MKHFNFRLQKYLNLKRQQEDIQRLILSNAQAAYDEEKRKLALIDRKIEALLEYNTTLRQMRLNIELLLFAESYHIVLSQQKEIQAVSVEDALVRLSAEREKEQKTLDEIGTSSMLGLRLKQRAILTTDY